MGKTKFVNNQLLKIRDKLPSELPKNSVTQESTNNTTASNNAQEQKKEVAVQQQAPVINEIKQENQNIKKEQTKSHSKAKENNSLTNEKEWKKAIFRRWDDFKNLKVDILKRIVELETSIPEEMNICEQNFNALQDASEKIITLRQKVESISDSDWTRHNFTNELGIAMRELEKYRIEFMMINAKIAKKDSPATPLSNSSTANNFIHELSSLTFSQCFRLGLGFFMPLIVAIIAATLLWGIIYFFSIH